MYSNFNNKDLSNIIKIKSVSKPFIPGTEHKTIDIWERQGQIFDEMKQKEFNIVVKFMIKPSTLEFIEDENILENKIRDLKRALLVTEPQALYLGSKEKFIFAMPIGEPQLTKRTSVVYEGEITFVAYDPAYYSEVAKQYTGEKLIECENEGDYKCYPIINVGIGSKAQFIQLENMNNNKKILIGSVPNPSFITQEEKTEIIIDECETLEGWTVGTTSVDSDRATEGGTLAMTNNGEGIKAGTYSTGNGLWKGVGARKNLGQNIKDFYVECVMAHNSSGINGDPTVGKNKTHTEEIKTGSRSKYYEVVSTTNVRTGASTKNKKIGTLKKGDKVTPISVSKGWIKFTFNGSSRYASTKYMKVKYKDNTTTVTTKNFVTNSPSSLRTSYNKTSKLKCTIPGGETVRLISSKKYLDPSDKKKKRYYYKLAEKYKGYTGYIGVSQVVEASNVSYEYDEELETSDDKTGIIEIYGWSNNNEKIFRLGLYDDDKYWEFTYPKIQVGSKDFLKDKTLAPAPRTSTEVNGSDDKLTVKEDTLLSGEYGDYNDFYGKIGIQRIGEKWLAWVYKYKDGVLKKKLVSDETSVNGSPMAELSYITLYMGTQDTAKASGTALYKLEVKRLNKLNEETTNISTFNEGDVFKFDCYNNLVYQNDKIYSNVDIGSQFFELNTGENTIKVRTDAEEVSTDVIYNERWS